MANAQEAPPARVTVVRLSQTGHVVAALTRAAPGAAPSVRALVGDALRLAVPGLSGQILVPAELLTAEEITAPAGVLAAPWLWSVEVTETGVGAVPLTGAPPAANWSDAAGGSLTVTTSPPATSGTAVLALVHPAPSWDPGVAPKAVLTGALDGDGVARLGTGEVAPSDHALVFVQGGPAGVYVPSAVHLAAGTVT
ncbi:hypothetical protein [Streptomyces sp. Tu102]|uniref:hypothetical protein n=1 Tax=Streptomyces sp. Tu102 TaxID=2838019 RepID=UPI001BDD4A40|nr:hypothetical protein [Streptomyces sp. Tu102]MBT1093472.1 hypothetical protein [Streptomyces sp. Tu102]